MHTLAHLAKSKPAFAGGSERRSLASGLERRLPKGKLIEWLEVGMGDGENLLYLLDELSGGRQFNVTAIDPSPHAAKRIVSKYPIAVLGLRIEDYCPRTSFDCINARQSAYYFENPQTSIVKLAGWLSPDGVLAITLWSPECVLYRLNRAIAHATCSDADGLLANELMEALPTSEFRIGLHREGCGRLDFEMLRQESGAFAAVVALAARKIDIGGLTASRLANLFDDFIRSERSGGERSNELIFVNRRSSLPTSKRAL